MTAIEVAPLTTGWLHCTSKRIKEDS
jgi:hypothetical protein